METRPFRRTCPAGRRKTEPCPCKPRQCVDDNCSACICEWEERAAIIEHDGGQTRSDAERQATEQLRQAIERETKGQRRLF